MCMRVGQEVSLYESTRSGEQLKLVKLTLNDIEAMMKLQDKVDHFLSNKEVYVCTSKEEFEETIKNRGCILGYKTDKGKLVALGAYACYGLHTHNYGYDLDLREDKLVEIGQVEMMIVDPEYRGNKLQKKLCRALEAYAKKEQKAYVLATVSPDNPYSLNNFLSLGYEIKKEKLKYGGLRRYILSKKLV